MIFFLKIQKNIIIIEKEIFLLIEKGGFFMATRKKRQSLNKKINTHLSSGDKNKIDELVSKEMLNLFARNPIYFSSKNETHSITSNEIQKYLLGTTTSETSIFNFFDHFYMYKNGSAQRGIFIFKEIYIRHYSSVAAKSNRDLPPGLIKKNLEEKYRGKNSLKSVLDCMKKLDIFQAFLANPCYKDLSIIRSQKMVKDMIPENLAELFPYARASKRQFILHIGDTNSGKTYEAVEDFLQATNGVYLSPLRLLAMEIQEKSNKRDVPCSLLTGEEDDFIPGATHISSTIEMLSPETRYAVAVIDEAQMIADKDRGWAWTKAVLGVCADKVHVCMSENATNIICRLIEECGDEYKIVEHKRNTPLVFENKEFVFPDSIQEKDALIVFSRKNVLSVAAELKKQGIYASKIYGSLPYEVRKHEVEKFINGETSVVVATDAIGMGMNLPIRRVVFLEDSKYDGTMIRDLLGPEVKQIAGRAGRRGMFDTGYVNAYTGKKQLKKSLEETYIPIRKAKVRMPDELLEMDMKLEDIMKLWNRLQNKKIYEHADLTDAFVKNRYIDEYAKKNQIKITNKEKWKLINIPIDYDEEKLFLVWITLMKAYCNKTPIRYELEPYMYLMNGELSDLELLYRILDAFYAFQRIEKKKDKKIKEELIEYKKQLSMLIMKELEKSPLKKCKKCGKSLAWNHKYNICNSCFENTYYGYC